MVTLAIEMTASRLLGSVFGTSNLVWASIIGLILIYLTIGYFLGGRWADRNPNFPHFFRLMLFGAFSSGLVPLLSRPVLRYAASAFDQLQMGILLGSFVAVIILFIVPITLLGAVSPFAIRLAMTDKEKAGDISGRIYAISTLGSFLGTFLPVLVVIPLVGTTYTFVIFSVYLMLVALIGIARSSGWKAALRWAWTPLLVISLGYWIANTPIKTSEGQIYERESSYNYIEVIETGGYRLLRLNDGQGVHSMYHPEVISFDGPWMQFLAAPYFNVGMAEDHPPERIAVIGLAAGTFARQATEVFGPVEIDGFEIDPAIIEVGEQYFGMTMPNLHPIAQDGRWGLAHSPYLYDIIALDAYRPPYIPWHLTTKEFFIIVREHLSERGVVAVNVGRAPEDRRLVDAITATLSTVFSSVFVMDVPETFNSVVYATQQPTTIDGMYANYFALDQFKDTHPVLLRALERTITNQKPVSDGGLVLVDDLAPVEWIVNSMVLQFIFSGDYRSLQ